MLQSLIKVRDPKTGKPSTWLNSLRRYCLSGVLVPTRERAIVKLPAGTATAPTRSSQIPIQGPQDAKTEIYTMVGLQGLTAQGVGKITSNGATATVTGSGTKFISQVQVGDTISTTAGSSTVATISSDTLLTVASGVALGVNAGVNYFTLTPTMVDPNKLFVEINDPCWRRSLMNKPVPVTHVFGDAMKPLNLRESLLLETNQTYLMTFLNYATSAASFAPTCEGRKWQYEAFKRTEVQEFLNGLRQRKQLAQPYWLTLDEQFITIPASGKVTKFFTTTGDITTFLFNLYGSFYSTSSQGTYRAPKIEFFDAKTTRMLQTQPLTIYTACGNNAQNPFVLPTPIIVEPQGQIQVNIENQYTDAAVVVYLTFHGTAMYTGLWNKGGALTDPAVMKESAKLYREMGVPQIMPASPRD